MLLLELGELSLRPCEEATSLLRSSQSELQSGASVDSLMISDHCFASLITVAGRKLGGTDPARRTGTGVRTPTPGTRNGEHKTSSADTRPRKVFFSWTMMAIIFKRTRKVVSEIAERFI
jgi:hypothetical protein